MSPNTPIPAVTTYRIEVSGWDEEEAFFVEKTDLEWSGEERKKVRLGRSLRDAAVVFVRLLQTNTQAHVCPVAYQVTALANPANSQPYEYSLMRLHPRGNLQ